MKPLAALALCCLLLPVAARAAAPSAGDRLAIVQLSALESHKVMLGLCGVSGEDLDKYLAPEAARKEQLESSLSDDGKQALATQLAAIDSGIQASWQSTPEDLRTKSCDALKSSLTK